MNTVRLGIPDSPSLGQMIRGARLGFFWASKHGCFIRIRRDGIENFLVQLRPCGLIPVETHYKDRCKLHFVWWEDEDTQQAVEDIPALHGLVRLKVAVEFIVNDLGERVIGEGAED